MKVLFFLIFCVFIFFHSFSQISQGGIPPSIKYNIKNYNVDKITIPKPNLELIHIEDRITEKHKGQYRVGVMIDVELNTNNSGTWTDLPCGGKIWRLVIHIEGALALNLFYKNFFIPKGGELYLYNKNQKQIIGAFTDFNNTNDGWFSTELIQGDYITLEYFQPEIFELSDNNEFFKNQKLSLEIFQIGYNYRGVEPIISKYTDKKSFGESDWCHINVNCPEGNNWQNQKRGVALTYSGGFLCSGTLINNTNIDFTPYFLTANHCNFSNYSTIQFYFNYESPQCQNPDVAPPYNTMIGAVLRASGSLSGGSDFKLLELINNVPVEYNPYFNGWDRTGEVSASGVSIHHPKGDIKKISTYNLPLVSNTFTGGLNNEFWMVRWLKTSNGHGVTEAGSSGAPLFDNNGRIIGTLTGGASFCDTPYYADYYGKFSAHWDKNGLSNEKQLKHWLDPKNTGVTKLDGTNISNFKKSIFLDNGLKIFPNPAKEFINIYFSKSNNNINTIIFYNKSGQTIKSLNLDNKFSNILKIPLDNFYSGIYYMQIISSEVIVTEKIIIIR